MERPMSSGSFQSPDDSLKISRFSATLSSTGTGFAGARPRISAPLPRPRSRAERSGQSPLRGVKDSSGSADKKAVRKRLRADQEGFGLIELLIAMVILNVGLLAIVASFQAGI